MKVNTNQERLNQLFDSDPRTDTAIAEVLGVSKQTVSMWRHGTRSPKKSVLVRISEVFGVSIEWLMGFDVEKDSSKSSVPIFIPDSRKFVKLIKYMPSSDYRLVCEIYEKAYKKMKEAGDDFDD